MRQRNEVRMRAQQIARKVANIGVQTAFVESVERRRIVDDAFARKIEQHHTFLHRLDALGVDQVAGSGQQRHMQADEIGTLDEIVDVAGPANLRGQPPGGIDGDFRVVTDDIHPELDRCFGKQRADGAKPDDAECAAAQLVTDEALLAGFDLFVQRFVVADQPADEAQRRKEITRAHQHAGDDEFLDGIGIGSRCVEDDDAFFAHRLDRDIVGAGAGAADALHARRDEHVVHDLRTHEDGVRFGNVVGDGIAFGQAGQPFLGDGVECLNLAFHAVCFLG